MADVAAQVWRMSQRPGQIHSVPSRTTAHDDLREPILRVDVHVPDVAEHKMKKEMRAERAHVHISRSILVIAY